MTQPSIMQSRAGVFFVAQLFLFMKQPGFAIIYVRSDLNSHYFHMIADKLINRGLHTHKKALLLKVGWVDPQYKEFSLNPGTKTLSHVTLLWAVSRDKDGCTPMYPWYLLCSLGILGNYNL